MESRGVSPVISVILLVVLVVAVAVLASNFVFNVSDATSKHTEASVKVTADSNGTTEATLIKKGSSDRVIVRIVETGTSKILTDVGETVTFAPPENGTIQVISVTDGESALLRSEPVPVGSGTPIKFAMSYEESTIGASAENSEKDTELLEHEGGEGSEDTPKINGVPIPEPPSGFFSGPNGFAVRVEGANGPLEKPVEIYIVSSGGGGTFPFNSLYTGSVSGPLEHEGGDGSDGGDGRIPDRPPDGIISSEGGTYKADKFELPFGERLEVLFVRDGRVIDSAEFTKKDIDFPSTTSVYDGDFNFIAHRLPASVPTDSSLESLRVGSKQVHPSKAGDACTEPAFEGGNAMCTFMWTDIDGGTKVIRDGSISYGTITVQKPEDWVDNFEVLEIQPSLEKRGLVNVTYGNFEGSGIVGFVVAPRAQPEFRENGCGDSSNFNELRNPSDTLSVSNADQYIEVSPDGFSKPRFLVRVDDKDYSGDYTCPGGQKYAPFARINTNATDEVNVSQSVEFDASPSEGDGLSYEWSFSNGVTKTGKVVTTQFDSQGEYTATLTVTNETGVKDTKSTTITVDRNLYTVAKDGSGSNTSVAEAVRHANSDSDKDIIRIMDSSTYKPADFPNIKSSITITTAPGETPVIRNTSTLSGPFIETDNGIDVKFNGFVLGPFSVESMGLASWGNSPSSSIEMNNMVINSKVRASGYPGEMTVNNVTFTSKLELDGSSSSDFTVKHSTFDGATLDALGSNGNWVVHNTTFKDISGPAINARKSSGDWTVRHTVIKDIQRPSVIITGTSVGAISADDSSGSWEVKRSVFQNIETTGLGAPGTTGSVSGNWWDYDNDGNANVPPVKAVDSDNDGAIFHDDPAGDIWKVSSTNANTTKNPKAGDDN